MATDLIGQARFYLGHAADRGLYILLRKKNGPRRVALASFPRSGSTWVRHLLEGATGEQTGSLYREDKVLPRGGRGIVVKTHGLDSCRFTHAVHLVRNPLDAIESYFRWTQDRSSTGPAPWEEFAWQNANYWKLHTRHWLHSPGHLHTIRYEDLHGNPSGVLQSLCRWLGYDLDRSRIDSAVEASQIEKLRKVDSEYGPKFFRRGGVGASYDRYSPELRSRIVGSLRPLLKRLDYRDLLETE
jgi:hypothetical protein